MDETRGPAQPGQARTEPRPEQDLLAALQAAGADLRLAVLGVPTAAGTPRSVLEAARLCEQQGYAYLLYGHLTRTVYAYHAELRLFDRDAGRIAAAFFASDDSNHYQRLVAEVASKVAAYLREEVGLAVPGQASEPRGGLWRVVCSLGYWTPLASQWRKVLRGFGTAGVGLRYAPVRPLFRIGGLSGYGVAGIDVEYVLAGNQPGYESSLLHGARIRLVAEAVLTAGRHALALAAGGLTQLDTLAQERLYDSVAVSSTLALGGSLALSYRYRASERLALGGSVVLDAASYDSPLLSISPRVSIELGPALQETRDE